MKTWNSANPTAAVIRDRAPAIPEDARVYDRSSDALSAAQRMADETGSVWCVVRDYCEDGERLHEGNAVVSLNFMNTHYAMLSIVAHCVPKARAA